MARYHQGWDEQMKSANAALGASLAKRKAPESYMGPDLACYHCGADSTPFLTCRSCAESGQ